MKVVVVIAPVKFNNSEFIKVTEKLKEHKCKVNIASETKSMAYGYIIKTDNGFEPLAIKPDILIKEIDVLKYDCIIIIGGSGNKKYLWKNKILHEKIKIAYENNKIIAAICLAPICLIFSGIIKNTGITAYKTKETVRIIKESGNFYIDKNVCINNNVITANGPRASFDFAKAIINKITI